MSNLSQMCHTGRTYLDSFGVGYEHGRAGQARAPSGTVLVRAGECRASPGMQMKWTRSGLHLHSFLDFVSLDNISLAYCAIAVPELLLIGRGERAPKRTKADTAESRSVRARDCGPSGQPHAVTNIGT
jgi:hypothetical protein